MGRVLTNTSSLIYGHQSAIDVDPTSWKETEFNTLNQWGATISTTPRNPISTLRQRRKGTTTDLDSGVEYEADLTVDSILDHLESFLFATATNQDMTFQGADAGATGYTIPSSTAAQAAKFQFTSGGPISLVYARGYAATANNGLKALSADLGAAETTLPVAGLTTETAPANAEVSVAGIRAEAGDLALAISSGIGTLTSGNNLAANNIDFTTLGLTVGQFIHIGGTTSANQGFSAASTPTYGYARITAIAAGALTLDKLEQANAVTGHPALLAFDGTDDNAGGTNVPIDLMFGRFVRNVAVDHASFLERYTTFEAGWPNLFPASATGYEYALNNLANTVQWNMPLTDKATVTFAFVGTDTGVPTSTRKSGASSAIEPLFTEAFNTSADFARLRITDVDETGLTTDFKNLTVSMNNNVTPEKVLGRLGAAYMNYGNFEIDIEGNALFTDPEVITRIRENTTVSFDMIVENDDGGIAIDVPSGTLGNGGRELPVNESVQIALTLEAFVDSTLGTSIGVSLFPITPASAP